MWADLSQRRERVLTVRGKKQHLLLKLPKGKKKKKKDTKSEKKLQVLIIYTLRIYTTSYWVSTVCYFLSQWIQLESQTGGS